MYYYPSSQLTIKLLVVQSVKVQEVAIVAAIVAYILASILSVAQNERSSASCANSSCGHHLLYR